MELDKTLQAYYRFDQVLTKRSAAERPRSFSRGRSGYPTPPPTKCAFQTMHHFCSYTNRRHPGLDPGSS